MELVCVAVLAAIAVWATVDHQRDDSPTLDEPFHVMAGAEYVRNGTYGLNLEHPPLVKLLAGAALAPLRLQPPAPGARVPSPHPDYLQWLYRNSAPAHVIVQYGRRPMPLFLIALVFTVYAIGRAAWGSLAGLLAAALIAFEPNIVGHAGVVHTDVAAALFVTATLGLALGAIRHASLPLWAAAGLVLGLAFSAKFSAVLLVPVVLAAPLLKPSWRAFGGAALAVVLGAAVLLGAYSFCMRRMQPAQAADAALDFLRSRNASPELLARQERLSTRFPALGHYAAGLTGVRLLDAGGRGANYLMGRVSSESFPAYFFVAFLVKSTPAILALALLAATLGRRELLSFWSLGLLLPAALFFAAAARSHFNIGQRHIMPVYPLLAIVGSGVLANRLAARAIPLAAALTLSSALSLWSAHPEELSYFNALAGPPERRGWWLSDSNIDWGQDLKRLGRELEARGWQESTTVVAYSGLATTYFLPKVRVLDPARPIAPGRYAVSALIEAVGPEFVRTFEGDAAAAQVRELVDRLHRSGRRIGRVGSSITLWELPAA